MILAEKIGYRLPFFKKNKRARISRPLKCSDSGEVAERTAMKNYLSFIMSTECTGRVKSSSRVVAISSPK
jgi:hypothetical protein